MTAANLTNVACPDTNTVPQLRLGIWRMRESSRARRNETRAGQHAIVVQELLVQHYDPTYERSTARNYAGFAGAQPLGLADGGATTLAEAARALHEQMGATGAP